MEHSMFVVDAFTDTLFKGNSAAVVPLKSWIDDDLMQKIAFENNLSETAFIKKITPNKFAIRWFSPLTEIDFCGHATLASAFILYHHYDVKGEIELTTLAVGSLFVKQLSDQRIEMSFPNQCPEVVNDIPAALFDGLSIKPIQVLKNRQAYFAVFKTVQEVRSVTYQAPLLKLLAPYDLVVTASDAVQWHEESTGTFIGRTNAISEQGLDNQVDAQVDADLSNIASNIASNTKSTVSDVLLDLSSEYDFVSRYFWPANGGDEDPVTGSIHAGLAPYWAKLLNKNKLHALQASARGGSLICELNKDRVLISGHAVLYLQGKISV